MGVSWQLASTAAADRSAATVALRAEPAGRGLAAGARAVSGSDRNTVRATATGSMVVFALGLPLMIVDSGLKIALRVPRGATVNEALDLAGVALGPLDRINVTARQDGALASGDVVQVVRVTDSETVVQEPIPFEVRSVADPTLSVGRTVIATAGASGLAQNTYRVRAADGVVEERSFIASTQLRPPVTEVRHVGSRPPPGPADIEGIIRTAAATSGADPTQLLRVAWCESRYDPSAYNGSSGASGLFQFLSRTWAANSVRAGYGGASVFDAVANANTAAYMFANQQAGQWQCK